MLRAVPHGYQQENWLLNPELYWEKHGQLAVKDLGAFTDQPQILWLNGHNSYNGTNDRIPLEAASKLKSSLFLIDVDDVTLSVFVPGEAFGDSKRRVQADFIYNGFRYKLWVTDPMIERPYLQRENGSYRLGHRHLCISLGEPHQGFCYKLVATVI